MTNIPRELTCTVITGKRKKEKSVTLTERNIYLHIYELVDEPKRLPDFNDYFTRAKTENNFGYYEVFLHFYEPLLNSRVRHIQESHNLSLECFLDMKQIFAMVVWEELQKYAVNDPIPMLTYVNSRVKREWNNYIARCCGTLTITHEGAYVRLQKVAAIYFGSIKEGRTEAEARADVMAQLVIDADKATELIAMTKLWRYADGITDDINNENSAAGNVNIYDIPDPSSEDDYINIVDRLDNESGSLTDKIRRVADTLSAKDRLLISEISSVNLETMQPKPRKTLSAIALLLGMADETAVAKKWAKVRKKIQGDLSKV